MNNTKRVFKIIKKNLLGRDLKLSLEDKFSEIGLTSIQFVKIVVDLESEFKFEFEDEKLFISAFNKVKDLVEYVNNKGDMSYEY